MTTDLWMLVWTAFLCLAMPMVYLPSRVTTPGGTDWGFGNRDEARPPFPAWAERAQRAHANLTENVAPFAILVLVAHVAGKANATTALGATIFFWARLAYVPLYVIGIPYVRTVAFFAAAAGEVLIAMQLFR
jgi:uncharacterized MAPEG superfamily protein